MISRSWSREEVKLTFQQTGNFIYMPVVIDVVAVTICLSAFSGSLFYTCRFICCQYVLSDNPITTYKLGTR